MERKWWTLVAVAVGVFMLLLDITIVNVALPDIQQSLGASLADLQWVIDAYALTLAALLLTAGSLADMYGRRKVFAIGIVVFTAGSLLCGLAGSPLFLTLSRAFQGIGGAIMFATSLALISNAFQAGDRGTAFGVFGAVTGVAVAVGPVIGGALVSGLSWRWIFLVNIPVGVVALAITLREVEESRNPHARRVDVVGLVTFSAGLAALVFGLIRSNEEGWGSSTVVTSLLAAVVLLVAFGIAEVMQREPMLDLTLLRKPTFVGGLIAAFAISASLFSAFPYLVLYLQGLLGLSAIEVGVRFLVLSGPIFITAAIAGRLSDKVSPAYLIGPVRVHRPRAAADGRDRRPRRLLAPRPGLHPGRHRRRPRQRAAGEHGGRRRRACARGHGVGDQLDVPPGGDRDRRGGAGRDLLPPRRHRPAQPAGLRRRAQRDPGRRRRAGADRGRHVAGPDPAQRLRFRAI
jgi:EmrB/QacA subfamily drug resistance transporter